MLLSGIEGIRHRNHSARPIPTGASHKFGGKCIKELMTLAEEIFEERFSLNVPSKNVTGVTWEFAFIVTDKMRAASRQRNALKWKAVEGFLKSCEKLSLPGVLGTKQ